MLKGVFQNFSKEGSFSREEPAIWYCEWDLGIDNFIR